MKNRAYLPFIALAALVFLVALACGPTTTATTQPPQPQTDQPVVIPPTDVPPPTDAPIPTDTEEPVAPPQQDYYVQEFDFDPGWYWDVIGPGVKEGNAEKATYAFENGLMVVNIDESDLYGYYYTNEVSYDDVRLDLHFENRGVNSQNVGLICRNSDEGWYELSIGSDGLWYIYAYAEDLSDKKFKYFLLANGGSTAIHQGKEVNEYTMICKGDEISFLINGVAPKNSEVTDRKYSLRRGGIGFNVSSLNAWPVRVEIDWLNISVP